LFVGVSVPHIPQTALVSICVAFVFEMPNFREASETFEAKLQSAQRHPR
jgi:hypothetical protein